ARKDRQLVAKEGFRSDVLQADRVQHSCCSFKHSRGRIARHRLRRKAFHYQATELIECDDVFEFDAVPESSAGSDDRILEMNAAESNAQVRPSACIGGVHLIAI